MNIDALSVCTVVGVVVAMVVDGQLAVTIASFSICLGLAPFVAYAGGETPALLMLCCGPAAAAVMAVSFGVAHRYHNGTHLDPVAPMFSQPNALFGPRSIRVAVAAVALPCAAWVSFNVVLAGSASGVGGLLFPAAYACICGVGRLLVARTLEDVAVGSVLVTLGVAAAWIARDSGAIALFVVMLGVCPLAACAVGWLSGQHSATEGQAA